MIPLLVGGATALAGGVGSAMAGHSAANTINNNIDAATGRIEGIKNRIPGQSAQVINKAQDAYSPYTQGASGDMDNWRNLIMSGGDLSYADADPFAYDLQGGIQQFMDPTVDSQIAAATGAVEGSAANTGGLFSSATGKAIADRAQRISQESWKDALQAAITDRGFQYDVYGGANQLQNKTDNMGQITKLGADATMSLSEIETAIKMNEFEGMNDADLKIAELLMGKQDDSWTSVLGNFMVGMGG
jgi:hypothetical protein